MPWATTASNSAIALGRDGRHRDDLVARPEDAPQRLAPADERLREQRPAVEMEQVEGEEGDRPARLAAPAAAPAPSASARPAPSTTTSSPSRIAERAATRTASPASSGSAAVTSTPAASRIRTSPFAGRVGRPDRRRAPARRPTTARTGARRSRTAPAADAAASAAGPGDRAAGRPRAAAKAGRPSSRW